MKRNFDMKQKILTADEILELDKRITVENIEFCLINNNQVLKAINQALKNQPDNRPTLEEMLIVIVDRIQGLREQETRLLTE